MEESATGDHLPLSEGGMRPCPIAIVMGIQAVPTASVSKGRGMDSNTRNRGAQRYGCGAHKTQQRSLSNAQRARCQTEQESTPIPTPIQPIIGLTGLIGLTGNH
mgnify:CR=1 FL=1